MQTENIVVKSMITEKIYRSYMNFHVYKRNKSWIQLPILSFFLFLFGLVNLFTNSPILAFTFITLSIYLFLSRFLRFYISVKRICKEHGLSEKPKLFYTLEINKSGLLITNKNEKATYKWNNLYHIYILENVIYIYLNDQNAFILPLSKLKQSEKELLLNTIKISVKNKDIITIKN